MIHSLYIRDFALLEEARIEFKNGLTILTGETGAGKSILVNAMAQLCGERSSPDFIRNGSGKAIIEAVIGIKDAPNFKQVAQKLDIDFEDSDTVIIRKEISKNGTSRTFVNDSPVTLSRLSQLSAALIDLHGQHQHQRLLFPENHLRYLDDFGELIDPLESFGRLLQKYKTLTRERDQLRKKQLNAYQTQDMYRYQDDELTKADLDANELDALKAELKVLANVELLHQHGNALISALYNGDGNASEQISQAEGFLGDIADLDPQFNGLQENLAAARETIEEIGRSTEQYLSGLQYDPGRMEFIHQRIAQLEFLLKKYQKLTIAALIEQHEQIRQFLGEIEQFDEEIEEKEKELILLQKQIVTDGFAISAKRRKIALGFEKKIIAVLNDIGMPNARFRVNIKQNQKEDGLFEFEGNRYEVEENGFDIVYFEISSNAGENFKPLHKIASGGEISRIMLALKSVLADVDKVPSLVFDEIDSGISGKVAQIVGRKLAGLSEFHQILCVTHLPQIAAFAHSHYKVSKLVENGRTLVSIALLNQDDQVSELANLLAGQSISRQAFDNARQLLKESREMTF